MSIRATVSWTKKSQEMYQSIQIRHLEFSTISDGAVNNLYNTEGLVQKNHIIHFSIENIVTRKCVIHASAAFNGKCVWPL